MAVLVLVALILAMAGHSSGATTAWCVCKDGSDAVLQKTLDYACGAGADCNPVHQNAPCFNPNTVRAHCNYAVNSYFQKKGQSPGSCDFAGTATVSSSDPSTTGCVYPASASTSTMPTPPGTVTTPRSPSTSTPIGGSPLLTTPSTGTFGNTGLGPSGINTDESDGGLILIKNNIKFSFFITLMFLGFGFLWA